MGFLVDLPLGDVILLRDIKLKYRLAGEAGLEPATFGFGDRCSSPLSYSPTSLSFLLECS